MSPVHPFKFEPIMASWLRNFPLLFAVLLLGIAGEAWGCPTCKDALAGDAASANVANGIGISILFMLSMPYLILLALGSYFYWEICKARAALKRKQELEAAVASEVAGQLTAEAACDLPKEELVGAS